MNPIPTPADYNLQHSEWRPHQHDSVSWCVSANGCNAVEAPVGSGKTSLARATSSRRSVIALCRTKNLQAENYGDLYGAAVLFGRGNYECIHKDAEVGATCDECLHSAKMTDCEFYSRCRYIQARDWARGSEFAALNYAYYLTAYWPRSPEDAPDVLFCDEAHQLSDITLDFAGCTLTNKQRVDWELPMFPEIIPNGRMLIKMSDPVDDALGWLNECYYVLRTKYKQLKQKGDGKGMAKCENLGRKVSATVRALERAPEDWYIKSGANARKFRGGYQPGFVARPLTARHHFPSYFNNGTVIMMSATIGDPSAFMGELGVEDYQFRAVPNQWRPEMRTVHILDAPRMGYKAKPEDYSKQADVIADAILALPTEWSGIVHVTRKSEADLLAKRLGSRGLADRVWVTPGWDGEYVPTDEQVDAWNRRRAAVSNSICVSWAMWEGYNGLDERICIAAKCFTPDVKLFGPHGFIDMDHADIGDEVFALNEQGEMIVDRIKAIVVKPYNGDIVMYKGEGYDISVTPDHRMLVNTQAKKRKQKFSICPANEIKHQVFNVPVAPPLRSSGNIYSSAWVTFNHFFDDETIIWADPHIKGKGRGSDLPDEFAYDRNRRMFKCRYKELSGYDIASISEIGNLYFSDGNGCNLIPYVWKFSDFVEMSAWFVTEGHAFHNKRTEYKYATAGEAWGISITQNEGSNLDRIIACANRINLPYRIDKKGEGSARVSTNSKVLFKAFRSKFGTCSRKKKISPDLMRGTTEMLQLLFDTMMRGDGATRCGSPRIVYSTSSVQLMEQVIQLSLMLGYSPRVLRCKDGCYDIGIATVRNRGTVKRGNVSHERYNGLVWCVTTSSGTVLTSRNGRFMFTGQCPFPSLGDEYEKQRLEYSHSFYAQRTAYQLEQGLGRTRRGRACDYGDENGFVAIADGNWTRVQKYLSQSLREAIVE